MKNKYSLFIIIGLLLTSCAPNYVDAVLELDTNYSEPGQLKFSLDLVKENGRMKHLKPGRNFLKWNKIQFSGMNFVSHSKGLLNYTMANLYDTNHLIKFTLTSQAYNLNKTFPINVPYVKGVKVFTDQIAVNEPTPLHYDLEISTGKRISQNLLHFSNNLWENKTNYAIEISEDKLTLFTEKPIERGKIPILFTHQVTKDTLWNDSVQVTYPNTINLELSGSNGSEGEDGRNGSNASDSGRNGTDGEHGASAQNVTFYISKDSTSKEVFLTCLREVNGISTLQFIPFNGGKIIVNAIGGNGGNGGNGGDGKNAELAKQIIKKDGTKEWTNPSVSGGNAGFGGDAGNGGNGGEVKIYATEELRPSIDQLFQINVVGGNAGIGGASGKIGKGRTASNQLATNEHQNNGKYGKEGRSGKKGNNGHVHPIEYVSNEFISSQIKLKHTHVNSK